MKTLTFLLFFSHVLNCAAQHVYGAEMELIITDFNGNIISPSEFSSAYYQLYIQKGEEANLYKEINVDSLGVIHISRSDIMPADRGAPWNIILIHNTDTMYVQYQCLHQDLDSPFEIKFTKGDYIYDLIRTTNTNIELEWELIEMEKIKYKEWVSHQIAIKRACIEKIMKGEYVKSTTTSKQN